MQPTRHTLFHISISLRNSFDARRMSRLKMSDVVSDDVIILLEIIGFVIIKLCSAFAKHAGIWLIAAHVPKPCGLHKSPVALFTVLVAYCGPYINIAFAQRRVCTACVVLHFRKLQGHAPPTISNEIVMMIIATISVEIEYVGHCPRTRTIL